MKAGTRKPPLYLSSNDMGRMVKTINKDRHRLGLALMAYGGLRVSEMCSLRINNLYLAREFLRVTGKGGKERIVPLSAFLQREIETYLSRYGSALGPDSLLLGRTRASWHYAVKKYSRMSLGRSDVHCHTLRHSFATALYRDGVQVERISELLGHARLDTTMIYAHISMEQKREAVSVLDDRKVRFFSFFNSFSKKKLPMTVKSHGSLIGRDNEITEVKRLIGKGLSTLLIGPKGCGKTAILRQLGGVVFIEEYQKKQSLIRIILAPKNLEPDVYKETEKQLKKLSIEELFDEILREPVTVVINDITELTKTDRKTISKLAEKTVVVSSSTRRSDVKLFRSFVEIKPLKRHYTRQILSEMIQMTDQKKKESVIDDILHTAGDNLKEAAYIASQLQLGKTTEEITTDERESNQVSIAPVLLIFILFFCAWVLKSYTSSVIAMSYAMLTVFRLVFMRYLFSPASRKRKV